MEELIADIESEIAARRRIAQVFYGKETSDKINSLITERDELLLKKQELSEKVLKSVSHTRTLGLTTAVGDIQDCTTPV